MKRLLATTTCLAFVLSVVPLAAAQQQPPEPEPPPPPQQPGPPPYGYPPPPGYGYPPPPYSHYGYPQPPGPEQIYRSGRRQRAVGMVLTFVGIGMGVLGFAMLYDAKVNSHNDADEVIEDLFGIFFTIGGVGCFIPGVILWANGAAKMDDALRLGVGGMSLFPPRMATAPGLTWTVRF
jgi:hypothetical protein